MKEELINELNELSSYGDKYKDRMCEIAKQLIAELTRPNVWDQTSTSIKPDVPKHRICRHGIERDSCHDCNFEASCAFEERKALLNNQ